MTKTEIKALRRRLHASPGRISGSDLEVLIPIAFQRYPRLTDGLFGGLGPPPPDAVIGLRGPAWWLIEQAARDAESYPSALRAEVGNTLVVPRRPSKPILQESLLPPGDLVGGYVKMGFRDADGRSEHMWVKVTSVEGGTLHGVLANQPLRDVRAAIGDPVEVQLTEVEDVLVFGNPQPST